MSTASVIDEVVAERVLQDAKWGEQNHPDGTGREAYPMATPCGVDPWDMASEARDMCQSVFAHGAGTWRDILQEEVYEAWAAEGGELRAELIQVAAVAVAWIEAIDRRAQNAED